MFTNIYTEEIMYFKSSYQSFFLLKWFIDVSGLYFAIHV